MFKEQEKIRVLLVDDQEVLRSGLNYILDIVDEVEIVGEASNGMEAVQMCQEYDPDVVMMDLVMPVMDGIEATRILTNTCPKARVIVLTSFLQDDKVKTALEAGALSYLSKNTSSEELAGAIKKAHDGIPTLSPEATQALISAKTLHVKKDYALSPCEHEILNWMAKGLNNPAIAVKLHISRSSAKRHVSNILHKMDAESRTKAVALAIQNNVIQ